METKSRETFYKKIAGLPTAVVAAALGAATISNAWGSLGFLWIRDITMICAGILWLLAAVKIIGHFNTFKAEYNSVVPSSLYAAFFMLLMVLSMYIYQWIPATARILFIGAIMLHAVHIVIFSFRYILRGVNIKTFVPSWFVTFNGIMVSTVTGAAVIPAFSRIILYYGLTVYAVLILFLALRLVKAPVDAALLHTRAIVLAPVSLCLASYLAVEPEPVFALALALYGLLLLSLLYIIIWIPRFFAVPFTPGFAGLTFPMAIGTVAGQRISLWLGNAGYERWGEIARQISGIQLYLTTAIIAFVMFNFLRLGCARLFSETKIQRP
jgi:exfoliative toxin A/B